MDRTIIIRENVDLAPLTTLGIGGPARYFAHAASEVDVIAALEHADERELDVFVLGGGSNIVAADDGFDGMVVHVDIKGVAMSGTGSTGARTAAVRAGAGEDWDELVAFAVERDLAGFECLSGIPGSVGGTPVQNVGAYGQEVSESIVRVRCIDRTTRTVVELDNAACKFSYRTSIFNSTGRGRYVVLSVDYLMVPGGKPKIAYKDLKEIFPDGETTLADVREAVLRIRADKSMVIDPADPNSRSAGSFFKNPVVDMEMFEAVGSAADDRNVPFFQMDDGRVKIPAAWLIENSGFAKGFSIGRVGISTKHSLALVNLGGATAKELLFLKNTIQQGVRERFGISLVPEPVFVGFPDGSAQQNRYLKRKIS